MIILVRFRLAHRLDRTFDADLPLERFPVEAQGRVGIFSKLDALSAFQVRIEDEPLSSIPFRSTMRTDGTPEASAVASAIALGSSGSDFSASAIHWRNSPKGSFALNSIICDPRHTLE